MRRVETRRGGALIIALALLVAGAALASDQRVGLVEVPNSKDLAAGTIDLAGLDYRVVEETTMTGLLGERIRLRDVVTVADGGTPHQIRYSARLDTTGTWTLTELTIIGEGYGE